MQVNNCLGQHLLPFGSSFSEETRHKRLDYLSYLGHKMPTYTHSHIKSYKVKSNIESFIGTMTIPVGLVGPLLMNLDGVEEKVYAPAATTEGALVASMNRGTRAISLSGGVTAYVIKKRMLRAPIFLFENISESIEFNKWLKSKQKYLAIYVKQFSKHTDLIEIKTTILGRNIETKFYYTTADASGQNMTTICTWQACKWIKEEFNKYSFFKVKDFILEGNGASDKKASYDSIINGRGVDVIGECIIDEKILNEKLKTKSIDLLSWYHRTRPVVNFNGMIGDNINVANSIAAIFTATGQDIACVHESAIGFLNLEHHERGLYMTLRLPKLVIGTIGGGTSLPSQKDNLELMNCYGVDKVERFAKLICGFSMGLELSTISAIVSGQFAIAHEKLGRNKPVIFLKNDNYLTEFIQKNLLSNDHQKIKYLSSFHESNGIITELTSKNTDKFLGLTCWELDSGNTQKKVLLKSKTTSDESLNFMHILTGMIDPNLANVFECYKVTSDFANGHVKEILIYHELQKNTISTIPEIHGLYRNDEREIYLILMEYIDVNDMKIFNSEMKSLMWTPMDISLIIEHHYKTLSKLSDLTNNPLFKSAPTRVLDFHEKALDVIKDEYGDEYKKLYIAFENALRLIKENVNDCFFETIIHNDFNPRNIAITKKNRPIIYDWELTRKGLPQRDFIELLSFTIDNKSILENMDIYMDETRLIINKYFNQNISIDKWLLGTKFAFSWYLVDRVTFYLLGNRLTEYPFIEKLIKNIETLSEKLGL